MMRFYKLGLMVKLGLTLALTTGMLVTSAQAELTPMTSQELSAVNGQASTGILVGLELRINQNNPGGTLSTPPATGGILTGIAGEDLGGTLNCNNSTNLAWCRIGLQFNSNYNWLLFKEFSGYLNLQGIELYGVDLSQSTLYTAPHSTSLYPNPSGITSEALATPTTALAINFTLPSVANGALVTGGTIPAVTTVAIRNMSYILAIASNNCTAPCAAYLNGGSSSPTAAMALQNQQAYLTTGTSTPTTAGLASSGSAIQMPTYCSTVGCGTASGTLVYSSSAFDTGKETGTLGVVMNGNLNVGGTIYAFAK